MGHVKFIKNAVSLIKSQYRVIVASGSLSRQVNSGHCAWHTLSGGRRVVPRRTLLRSSICPAVRRAQWAASGCHQLKGDPQWQRAASNQARVSENGPCPRRDGRVWRSGRGKYSRDVTQGGTS